MDSYRQKPGYKEYKAESDKCYHEINYEILAEKHKVYAINNKELLYNIKRNHYLRHKPVIQERVRKYKLDHPDQYRMYSNKRLALKKTAVVNDFTHSDIVEKYGNECVYCGGAFEHIDHYVPLSKGGEHTLDNVRPSCRSCNLTKNNKMPEDFLKLMSKRNAA
jgi:5-methylcytosine-specific restriction endonuclease McrA